MTPTCGECLKFVANDEAFVSTESIAFGAKFAFNGSSANNPGGSPAGNGMGAANDDQPQKHNVTMDAVDTLILRCGLFLQPESRWDRYLGLSMTRRYGGKQRQRGAMQIGGLFVLTMGEGQHICLRPDIAVESTLTCL
jgi:hypothetical protein